MRKTPKLIKSTLFFLVGLFIVMTTTSGYLYHQNKSYQHENQRLVVLNDSILSENIELKNRLQQKGTAAMQNIGGRFKTKEKP
ncbi:MAG: hypothetical protein ACXVBJ_04665 [Flavisolibacter sp.]